MNKSHLPRFGAAVHNDILYLKTTMWLPEPGFSSFGEVAVVVGLRVSIFQSLPVSFWNVLPLWVTSRWASCSLLLSPESHMLVSSSPPQWMYEKSYWVNINVSLFLYLTCPHVVTQFHVVWSVQFIFHSCVLCLSYVIKFFNTRLPEQLLPSPSARLSFLYVL